MMEVMRKRKQRNLAMIDNVKWKRSGGKERRERDERENTEHRKNPACDNYVETNNTSSRREK